MSLRGRTGLDLGEMKFPQLAAASLSLFRTQNLVTPLGSDFLAFFVVEPLSRAFTDPGMLTVTLDVGFEFGVLELVLFLLGVDKGSSYNELDTELSFCFRLNVDGRGAVCSKVTAELAFVP